MEIKDILKPFSFERRPEKSEKSERAEMVKKFVVRLNEQRLKDGFKVLPASFYAIKMAQSKLSTNDLYWFYRYCDEATNFSKCWWWSLRGKQND